MLRTLRIRNLAIVEDVSIEFGPGLNVLTGETGAGKSILVDALGLATGARAERELIRAGEDKAIVEALFEWAEDSAVARWLRERGDAEPGEPQAAIRRDFSRSGGGRILVNGSPWTQAMLRELGDRLLELHGQHEHQDLRSPERHLEILDRFGGHDGAVERVAAACAAVSDARGRRDELRSLAESMSARQAELEAVVREIEAVAPRPGELDEIDRERRVLRNAEQVGALLEQALATAYDGEPSAAELAAAAARHAAELARYDSTLAGAAERARAAALELQEVGEALRDYRERAEFDPQRLERLEARRVAIERLMLRHGGDERALLGTRDAAREEIARLGGLGREAGVADAAVLEAERAYVSAAARLGRERRAAAGRLVPAVEAQLAELALAKARFDVAFEAARGPEVGPAGDGPPLALGPRGAERAEFLLAPNPGEPPRPLHKAASGGELARVMLALHAAADRGESGRAVVFDEVDAGIGGAVADAVGARLARIARGRQVLSVTHLPQVAAYADTHLVVRKRQAGGRTAVAVAALSREERVEEIARMLGTRKATETSRLHATELLRNAGRRPLGREA